MLILRSKTADHGWSDTDLLINFSKCCFLLTFTGLYMPLGKAIKAVYLLYKRKLNLSVLACIHNRAT